VYTILIGVKTDDVAEEPQTPEHDRLCDRRLSTSQADLPVGYMSSERTLRIIMTGVLDSSKNRLTWRILCVRVCSINKFLFTSGNYYRRHC